MGPPVPEREIRGNSRLVKAAACVVVALLTSLLMVSAALADRLQEPWEHSVDLSLFYENPIKFNPDIRYEILTDNYASVANYGIEQWSRLLPVCWHPDDAVTVRDLAWTSNNYGDVAWVGQWQFYYYGSDIIRFNRYQMERATYNNFYGVGVHEGGHALGLGHPGDTAVNEYLASASIMYWTQSGLLTWRSYDRESYNRRWQDYYDSRQIGC